MRALTYVLVVLTFSGCGAVNDGVNLYTSSSNRSALNKLAVGMTRAEVVAIMGDPHKREADGRAEFLVYRTETYDHGDSSFTPIVLIDGKVTGWGRNFYDNVRRSEITVKPR